MWGELDDTVVNEVRRRIGNIDQPLADVDRTMVLLFVPLGGLGLLSHADPAAAESCRREHGRRRRY